MGKRAKGQVWLVLCSSRRGDEVELLIPARARARATRAMRPFAVYGYSASYRCKGNTRACMLHLKHTSRRFYNARSSSNRRLYNISQGFVLEFTRSSPVVVRRASQYGPMLLKPSSRLVSAPTVTVPKTYDGTNTLHGGPLRSCRWWLL
jgi:hypothetical protein